MQQTDFFVWNVDPTAFDLGALSLPFPISIWGLVVAIAVFFWGYSKLVPEENTGKANEVAPEPEGWKVLALGAGALIGGQLLFLLFDTPVIEQIGPIQPRWYGVLFAGGFAGGYLLEKRMFKDAGRTNEELELLFTYVLIATVVGARLGHVIFYDLGYYLRNPGEIIAIWHGGLASHGAAIGILYAMYLYAKKMKGMSFLWLADRVVVAVAVGGAFIRTGNFFNSEIVGKPTELPWGVIFAQRPDLGMVPHHPTMLYEAFLCLIVLAVLWGMYVRFDRQPPEGSIFAMFLILLFGGRFFLEFTKIPQAEFAAGWALNMGQWLSLPLVALGVWLFWKKINWSSSPATNQ